MKMKMDAKFIIVMYPLRRHIRDIEIKSMTVFLLKSSNISIGSLQITNRKHARNVMMFICVISYRNAFHKQHGN